MVRLALLAEPHISLAVPIMLCLLSCFANCCYAGSSAATRACVPCPGLPRRARPGLVITAHLVREENTLGLEAGDGWFSHLFSQKRHRLGVFQLNMGETSLRIYIHATAFHLKSPSYALDWCSSRGVLVFIFISIIPLSVLCYSVTAHRHCGRDHQSA